VAKGKDFAALALFVDGKLDAGAFEHMSSARRWRR